MYVADRGIVVFHNTRVAEEAHMETPVRQLLQNKGDLVWSVTPDTSVLDALAVMAEKDIGALVVLENNRLVGIITERDYARKVILVGRSSKETPVRAIMTEQVMTVPPERTVGECMAIMNERHLRHLPVVENGQVLGVLSIRDVVGHIIRNQHFLIEQLTSYIQA
jgi:signal-transduction protein with cAMP-binding, CBS, and nucleotidyltransferase domain